MLQLLQTGGRQTQLGRCLLHHHAAHGNVSEQTSLTGIREADFRRNLADFADVVQQSAGNNQILVHALNLLGQGHCQTGNIHRMLQQTAQISMMHAHACGISHKALIGCTAENSFQQHTQSGSAHCLDIIGKLSFISLYIKITMRQQIADIILRQQIFQTLDYNLQRHIIIEFVDVDVTAHHKGCRALKLAQLVYKHCIKADKSNASAVILQHTAGKNTAVRGIAYLLYPYQNCLAHLDAGFKIFNHSSITCFLYMLQQQCFACYLNCHIPMLFRKAQR